MAKERPAQRPKTLCPIDSNEKNGFPDKISTRLVSLILAVSTLILVCLSGATYFQSFLLFDEIIEEKSTGEVEIALNKIAKWIEGRRKVIQVLAHVGSRGLNSHHGTKEYFIDIASELNAKAIYYLDVESDNFISSDNWTPPIDWDVKSRPWYIEAIASDNTIITSPYKDQTYPFNSIITIASAIKVKGTLKGIIAMDVSIDSLRLILSEIDIGKYSRSYLATKDGQIIDTGHSDSSSKNNMIDNSFLNDFIASNKDIKIYQEDEYRVFASIPNTPFIVAVHTPDSEAHIQLTKLSYIFVSGFFLSLIILFISVKWMSRVISRPIILLSDGAKEIIDGNYSFRIPPQTKDEIGLLTHRFNLMAEGLQEKEVIRSAFGRYVSPEAVHEILNGNIDLGGEKRLITTLICDLRGFTAYSEACDPETLVSQLNEYFTRMDAIIRNEGGSINRYLGDGILALFGAPSLLENSALAAVNAAIKMSEEMQVYNAEMGTTFELGIGVHTGVGIVGNIGSMTHTEYTVIGDVANLTSRIESLTKLYGEKILISAATSALLPQGMFTQKIIDRVKVHGRSEFVYLYSPSIKSSKNDVLNHQTKKIVEKYLMGDFESAANEILNLTSDQRSIHLETILKRCQDFITHGSASWDGSFSMESK